MYMNRKRAVYGRWNKPKNLNWWMNELYLSLACRRIRFYFTHYINLAIKLFIQINIDDRIGLLYTIICLNIIISRHILYRMNMDFSISVLHFFAYSISCKNNLPLLVFLWKYAKAKCQDNPFWWKVFLAYLKLRWQAAVKTRKYMKVKDEAAAADVNAESWTPPTKDNGVGKTSSKITRS